MSATTATAAAPTKFQGWAGFDKDSVEGKLRFIEYDPKEFAPEDVDIKVLYCGVCATDISILNQGWFDSSFLYPLIAGHEIVGRVIRVGDKAEGDLKLGDLVGVGAQCDSCLECGNCHAHAENYCDAGITSTYGAISNRTGAKSNGGFANFWRGPSRFVIPIPEGNGLDPSEAAPFLCGGATVYSPLKKLLESSPETKTVGVLGIGGLGHFAILFTKAMGAKVVAISHSAHKEKDAKELGADQFIVTGDDIRDAFKSHKRSLDFIISTTNDPKMPIDAYLSLLKVGGKLHMVGAAETPTIAPFSLFSLMINDVSIGSSVIASPKEIQEMFEFVAAHKIRPWIQKYPLSKINEAIPALAAGKAKYRFVLVNEENGGKL